MIQTGVIAPGPSGQRPRNNPLAGSCGPVRETVVGEGAVSRTPARVRAGCRSAFYPRVIVTFVAALPLFLGPVRREPAGICAPRTTKGMSP